MSSPQDLLDELKGRVSDLLGDRPTREEADAAYARTMKPGSVPTLNHEQALAGGLLVSGNRSDINVIRMVTGSHQSDGGPAGIGYRGKSLVQDLATPDAKAMLTWRIPVKPGTAVNGIGFPYTKEEEAESLAAPLSQYKDVTWAGAHYYAQDPGGVGGEVHGHWSVEVPDTTGALRTRFQITYINPNTGEIGVENSLIKMTSSDFSFVCSGQTKMRVTAPGNDGTSARIELGRGDAQKLRRWDIRMGSNTETGGNGGSPFEIRRYDDAGNQLGVSLAITRSSGDITLGGRTTVSSDHATPFRVVRQDNTPVMSVTAGGITVGQTIDVTTDTAIFRAASSEVMRLYGADKNIGVGGSTSFGSGKGVIGIRNATAIPSGNPANGGVLYVEAGALKWKGSAGTVTELAPA